MAETSWAQILVASLGGGITVKILDIAYQEVRTRFRRTETARKLVDQHLDPILKAADEIVSKLRSLAEEDFRSLHDIEGHTPDALAKEPKVLVLLYVFANFWARIELLRRDTIAVSLQQHPKGRLLKHFFDCLESRRVRLVERAVQRAIGETLIDPTTGAPRTVYFLDFAKRVRDPEVFVWYSPLCSTVVRFRHTRDRQRVLGYGAVLHALIDTLDPKHHVTGDRPGWANKLTKRTTRALQFRVFGRYLGFVRTRNKYVRGR